MVIESPLAVSVPKCYHVSNHTNRQQNTDAAYDTKRAPSFSTLNAFSNDVKLARIIGRRTRVFAVSIRPLYWVLCLLSSKRRLIRGY